MKQLKLILSLAWAGGLLVLPTVVRADTITARCEVYRRDVEQATYAGPCTFSQRQGFISIQVNHQRYELSPVGDQPGNYVDANGRAAYRQAGLGDKGQIYRLNEVSVYVYWN